MKSLQSLLELNLTIIVRKSIIAIIMVNSFGEKSIKLLALVKVVTLILLIRKIFLINQLMKLPINSIKSL